MGAGPVGGMSSVGFCSSALLLRCGSCTKACLIPSGVTDPCGGGGARSLGRIGFVSFVGPAWENFNSRTINVKLEQSTWNKNYLKQELSETRTIWIKNYLNQELSEPRTIWSKNYLKQELSETRTIWSKNYLKQELSETRTIWNKNYLKQELSETRTIWNKNYLKQELSEG